MSRFWYLMMENLPVFVVLLPIIFAEEYIIEREVKLIQGSWTDQPDSFMLPSTMCSGDISANCTTMGGTRIVNKCGCSCNKENEFREFYKSTFGFYGNEWKCFENNKVRAHSGCLTIMNERQDTIHLMTLPMATPKVGHHVPGLTTNCSITGGKYLGCDGKWHQLNITLVKNRFYLEGRNYLYYSISQPPTPTINGRVIKLEIECVTQPKKTQCVLFKVKGQLKCPLTTPTSSSISSTAMHSSKVQEPTTTPTVTDQFNKTGERAGSHGDNTNGIIAGAFAGVIGLVMIVIAIIVVVRRRKKRYHVPTTSNFVENESYGLGADATLRFVVPGKPSQDENDYSYMTTNLNRELEGAVSQRLHDNEDREYAEPYRTDSKSQANSDTPIYDALQETQYPNIDGSEKEIPLASLYKPSVLEERGAGDNTEPPEYQDPEGRPYSESPAVFDFPEGHGLNRASVDGPIPNERDNNTIYYSVGDVITDQ